MWPHSSFMIRELPAETMDIFLDVIVTLQIVGLTGCAITLGTVIFSKIYRRPMWLSFMITWIVSSISYLLLLLSGHLEDPKPPFGLCVIQASLIYSVPLLTSASTLALVTQLYLEVQSLFSERVRQHERFWSIIFLFTPYFLFLATSIGYLMVQWIPLMIFSKHRVIKEWSPTQLGLNNPSVVHRGSIATPYCNMTNRIPTKISSISVAALLIPMLILEGLICKILKDNWSVIRGRQVLLSTATRVLGFSVLGMVAIALSLIFASTSDRDPEMNVVISTMPIAAFCLFGTQGDILRVWMFWKQDSSAPARNTISSENELSELVNKAEQRV